MALEQQLHWLPDELRVKLQVVHTGQCPPYLADMVLPTAVSIASVPDSLRVAHNDMFSPGSVPDSASVVM